MNKNIQLSRTMPKQFISNILSEWTGKLFRSWISCLKTKFWINISNYLELCKSNLLARFYQKQLLNYSEGGLFVWKRFVSKNIQLSRTMQKQFISKILSEWTAELFRSWISCLKKDFLIKISNSLELCKSNLLAWFNQNELLNYSEAGFLV